MDKQNVVSNYMKKVSDTKYLQFLNSFICFWYYYNYNIISFVIQFYNLDLIECI